MVAHCLLPLLPVDDHDGLPRPGHGLHAHRPFELLALAVLAARGLGMEAAVYGEA